MTSDRDNTDPDPPTLLNLMLGSKPHAFPNGGNDREDRSMGMGFLSI